MGWLDYYVRSKEVVTRREMDAQWGSLATCVKIYALNRILEISFAKFFHSNRSVDRSGIIAGCDSRQPFCSILNKFKARNRTDQFIVWSSECGGVQGCIKNGFRIKTRFFGNLKRDFTIKYKTGPE